MIGDYPIKETSDDFYFFLLWSRDKLKEDGWDWEQICNTIIDIVQSPYKFRKEMEEYLKQNKI